MKKLTKILVLILSVALVCTGVIIAVSASEATELDVTKADGGTLVLDGDVKVSNTIDITESLTIDLAGHNLTSVADVAFNVIGKVDFAIIGGGSITVDGGIVTADKANVKIAGGLDGIKVTQTGVINDQPIAYTGSGSHYFTNLEIVSYATSTDLFSIGGASYNAFGATSIVTTSSTAKDDSNKALKSVIAMRDGGVSLVISSCTIETKAINAISIANNTLRYDDFVRIDNSRIVTDNADTANGSSAKPSFLVGDALIASDILINDSYVSYSNQFRLRGNTSGSALIFNNTAIVNTGSGDSFFNTVNVKLEGSCSVYGNSQNSDYVNKAPLFNLGSDYKNPGSMTVGDYKKVNLIIGIGTRFDEATYKKIVNQTATIGTSNYKYYEDGQIVFDNGMLPGAIISGEEGVVSYKFIVDSLGHNDDPYIVVNSDRKDFSEGTIHYKVSDPTYSAWGTFVAGEDIGEKVTKDGNTYWYYEKGAAKSAPCYIYDQSKSNTAFSSFNYNVMVFDAEFMPATPDSLASFYISLSARISSGDGRDGNYIHVANDGTISSSGKFVLENNSARVNLNSWNHISIILDRTAATGTVYLYLNGEYLGSGIAYQANVTSIFGLRFDLTSANAVGKTLLIDNPAVRGYNGTVSGNVEEMAQAYLYGGGVSWNDIDTQKNGIEAGGKYVPTLSSALALNRDTGAIATLTSDIVSKEVITEGGKIISNGYSIITPEGSLPSRTLDGITHFSEEYDVSIDVKFYIGEYLNEEQMNDPAYYITFYDCQAGTVLSDLLAPLSLPASRALYNNYYKDSKPGWAFDPNAMKSDVALDFDFIISYKNEHPGEALNVYPIHDYEQGAVLYHIIVVKADGTVDESRCQNVNMLWNGNLGNQGGMRLEYGETIILQKDVACQNNFSRAWFYSANDGNNDGTGDKTINIDLNGHTLKLDNNLNQISVSANGKIHCGIPVISGETINVYSTHAGGRIQSVGGSANSISGGSIFVFEPDQDSNGTIDIATNAAVNIGKFVKEDGTVIPGSNLTIEATNILDMTNADPATSSATIDGANITVDAIDNSYAGVFMAKGTVVIKNAIIVAPLKDGIKIFSTLDDGTYENSTMVVDNCTILTSTDGEGIFGNLTGMESITFTNCVTNGSFNVDANSTVKVIIGVGNIYYQSTSALLGEGIVESEWNNPTVFTNGLTELVVNYFKVKENNDWTARADDYDYYTYKIIVGGESGENVLSIPATLAYKTIGENDKVTVTYNVLGGEPIVQTYIKGEPIGAAPEIPPVILNALKLVCSGEFDIEIPAIAEENIVITPIYEAVVMLEGILASVDAIDADFAINLYIPAAYAEFISSIKEGAKEYAEETVTVDGVDYIVVTVYREAFEVNADTVIAIALSENGYEAVADVTINLAEYAKAVIEIEDGSVTAEDKALVLSMLKYSAEAMKYYGVEADESIDAILSAAELTVYDYATNAVDASALSAVFSAVAFDIASENLAYVFTVNEEFAGAFTVTIGDKVYTQDNVVDGKIKISGLAVYELAIDLTVSALDAEGNTVVEDAKYNLATYVNAIKNSESSASEECLALVEALYNYAMSADAYRNPVDAPAENPSEDPSENPAA